MTGKTHRQYSICFAFIACILLNSYGITQINYYLTVPIMLMAGKFGAALPDVDHQWKNVGDKTTVKFLINKFIHLTGGKHRSWQTHSIDICAWFTALGLIIPSGMYTSGRISLIDKEIATLLLLGVASGWISHLFSDMLTSDGVRLFCFYKKKVALVPKKLFGLRFNTGNEWEEFNYNVMRVLNNLLGVLCILYPYLEEITGFIKQIVGGS